MLAGLVGPEDVEENEDDFSDMAMPSGRLCVSSEGPVGCGLGSWCGDGAELKGPLEAVLPAPCDLLLARMEAAGLKRSSPPDGGR